MSYADLAATAKALLASYGRVTRIVLNVTSYGAVDPATGEADATVSTYQLDAVTVNYKASEIDGTRVLAGDVRVIAEAGTVLAVVGNTATIDGEAYCVVNVEPVNPGGVRIVQKWQVRK